MAPAGEVSPNNISRTRTIHYHYYYVIRTSVTILRMYRMHHVCNNNNNNNNDNNNNGCQWPTLKTDALEFAVWYTYCITHYERIHIINNIRSARCVSLIRTRIWSDCICYKYYKRITIIVIFRGTTLKYSEWGRERNGFRNEIERFLQWADRVISLYDFGYYYYMFFWNPSTCKYYTNHGNFFAWVYINACESTKSCG